MNKEEFNTLAGELIDKAMYQHEVYKYLMPITLTQIVNTFLVQHGFKHLVDPELKLEVVYILKKYELQIGKHFADMTLQYYDIPRIKAEAKVRREKLFASLRSNDK